MTADAHLPEDTYPLQVAVPWAIVWLRDGRREFERKQAICPRCAAPELLDGPIQVRRSLCERA